MIVKPARETRQVEVDGRVVPYVLKRYRGRSSVGLIVDHRGLTVTAPRRASDRYIVDAILEHAAWLLQKLELWRERTARSFAWQDGCVIPYLGEPVTVTRDLFHSGAPALDASYLRVAPAAEGALMQQQIVDWYRAQAKAYLPPRVAECSERFALPHGKVIISNAETRWGSCNFKRELRFSWRLMKAPPKVIDYVVAHELAHVKHMNHGGAFWALVARMYPQYKAAQKVLRRNDASYRAF